MLNKLFLIIALLCSSVALNAQNMFDKNPDYMLSGQSNTYKFYINTKTIKKNYDGYYVWVASYLYNNRIKERNFDVRLYKDKRYQKFLYSLVYYIFDMDNSKSKIVSIINYDYNGNILSSNSCDYLDWSYFVPGSAFESVSNMLQQYISENAIE